MLAAMELSASACVGTSSSGSGAAAAAAASKASGCGMELRVTASSHAHEDVVLPSPGFAYEAAGFEGFSAASQPPAPPQALSADADMRSADDDDDDDVDYSEEEEEDHIRLQQQPAHAQQGPVMAEEDLATARTMHASEVLHMASASYLTMHKACGGDVTPANRTMLLDWMSDVNHELGCSTETLCLAVSILDRFLSRMKVLRKHLQLAGAAALFLAIKYEEVVPRPVDALVEATQNAFTAEQTIRMEKLMLEALQWQLTVVTPYSWLCSFFHAWSRARQANCNVEEIEQILQDDTVLFHLSCYFMELSLQEYELVGVEASLIAQSSVMLAFYTLDMPAAVDTLSSFFGWDSADMSTVLDVLWRAHVRSTESPRCPNGLTAVYAKFTGPQYMHVACYPPVPSLP